MPPRCTDAPWLRRSLTCTVWAVLHSISKPNLDPLGVARYLFFVQPLVDDATFAKTKIAVEEFRNGAGPRLQQALVSKDDHHPETSYVAGTTACVHLLSRRVAGVSCCTHTTVLWSCDVAIDIWMDMYLKNRDPFPLNLTPYLAWKDHEIPAKNEQVVQRAVCCGCVTSSSTGRPIP